MTVRASRLPRRGGVYRNCTDPARGGPRSPPPALLPSPLGGEGPGVRGEWQQGRGERETASPHHPSPPARFGSAAGGPRRQGARGEWPRRETPAMTYLAHLSDIHVTAPRLEWRLRDWFTKRWPGWVNFRWLGRRFRFRMADEVLRALTAELRQRR